VEGNFKKGDYECNYKEENTEYYQEEKRVHNIPSLIDL
jgi:hypothetical protein